METNFYTITVPPMMKALEVFSAILDKAAAAAESKKLDWMPAQMHEIAILNDRLIFDQFPFVRQVQIACDNAKGGAARLAGIEAPKFEDTETTVAELKARIEKTIAFLKTIKPEQIIGQEDRDITLPYMPNKKLKAFSYATEYLIPNFYFHITTAYSILRKNGIVIGKSDYIGTLPYFD